MLSFSRSSRYRQAFVEKLRWVVAMRLGPDFDFEVGLREDPATSQIDALVYATYLAHELVDEQEKVQVPDGPWNLIRAGLNGLLERFDAACRKRSIEPVGLRFRVQTRPIVVKRVYHACPHLSKEHKGHDSWIFSAPREQRMDFRCVHRMAALVREGIKGQQHPLGVLYEIDHYLKTTGALE